MSQVDMALLWDGFEMIGSAGSDLKKGICVMQVVDWVTDRERLLKNKGAGVTDHPICTDESIGSMMITLNDATKDQAQRKKLLPFIHRLVGTRHKDNMSESQLAAGYEYSDEHHHARVAEVLQERLNQYQSDLECWNLEEAQARLFSEFKGHKKTFDSSLSSYKGGKMGRDYGIDLSNGVSAFLRAQAILQGVPVSEVNYDAVARFLDDCLPDGPVYYKGKSVVEGIFQLVKDWREANPEKAQAWDDSQQFGITPIGENVPVRPY